MVGPVSFGGVGTYGEAEEVTHLIAVMKQKRENKKKRKRGGKKGPGTQHLLQGHT